MHPEIDLTRLRSLFDGVNRFGRNPATGGFSRPGFSAADMAARDWFEEQMRGDGLAVHRDGAANLFARFGPADGPCVMVGSHLDTVPDGGAFDGVLGTCVALECVRALKDAGIVPGIAVEVVATSEEEGRFGGMLGSQAIAGLVSREWLEAAVDHDDVRLVEAMRSCGLDPERVFEAAREPGSVAAFLELHVEQGPVLEEAGVPLGIAHTVSGLRSLSVRLVGRANHSGTTPMHLRADAFAGLAEIAASLPDLVRSRGTDQSRVTIGKVELSPNFPHTIPGLAEFSLIVRDTEEAVIGRLVAALEARIATVAAAHGLAWSIEERSRLEPVALDASLAAMLRAQAEALGLPTLMMPSGAGHDAQTMQSLCPSALVFVPSRDGVSHEPGEWTEWGHIEKGARLMLAALVRLVARA